MVRGGMRVVLCLMSLCASAAWAEEKEPAAIIELGGVGEWDFTQGKLGPSAAIEFTPIKDWLEIEAGVSPLFGGGRTEWSTDLLFKKPFTLSKTVEFMIGAGPEWSYTNRASKIGAEFALDFMVWPWPDRKLGWFVEPTYGYSFSKGHEQAAAVSVGLLIPIP